MEDLAKMLKVVIENQERLIDLLKKSQPESVEVTSQVSGTREMEIFMQQNGRDS